jgi:4'-phosphopantetheinyl transferase
MVNEIFQKNDFTESFLNSEEMDIVNGFKALKKQVEWICGRYLIKQMIQSLFLKKRRLDQISVSYLEQGAPQIAGHFDIPISISHSNDYTAVACSLKKERTMGLDIEKISKKPDKYFLKTAFTENEISNLSDDVAHIFQNWTIKEAYLKYIKKGFNESLHKVEVIDNNIFHNLKKIDVNIYSKVIHGEYMLSLVSD